jgi:hypothetical protein
MIAALVFVLAFSLLILNSQGSAPATASAAPAAVAPATSGVGAFTVASVDLGIHAFHVKPNAPVGSTRHACIPTWRQANPKRGVYDFTYMDSVVNRSIAWGFKDIVHVFCGTPAWAAGSVSQPKVEALGYKSTAAPKSMTDYEAFVTQVVKRYKGRITAYQPWNEPTAKSFFQGTPKQMAEMTRILSRVVATHDPAAVVVSAPVQQFNSAVRAWGLSYLKELKARSWPVEVFSFHGYASTGSGANGRQSVISGFKRQLSSLGAPRRPLWDTEVTYLASRQITGETSGALVIRSYLDGWRMGVKRTYWYMWTQKFNPFGEIQMRPGTPAAVGLKRFGDQVIGAKYNGCKEGSNGLVKCSFTRGGQDFTIMWAEGKAVTVSRTAPTRYQNLVTGSWATSKKITVKGTPLLVNVRL